jgi:uncharacterized membrane protein
MEIYIFFAGVIMMLIVSSGLALSMLFMGDLNPDSRNNRRVNYTLSELKDNDTLKKLIREIKEHKVKIDEQS